ncbi:MAG: chemotaxis protein CheX [Planctomycetaceae bacterium]|nr:chemotaxis protein CheX [Planctomycetaceae bacterium]
MTIDQQTLQQVVTDVCSGMLGLEVEPSEKDNAATGDALSAVVKISGGWDSLVQVLAPRKTAKAIASTMFAMNEDELTEAEIRDAVGEIVNMVGGNLKGIVEGDSSLSLPCVGEATGSAPFDENFKGLEISNSCQGDPLIVRVFDRSRCES